MTNLFSEAGFDIYSSDFGDLASQRSSPPCALRVEDRAFVHGLQHTADTNPTPTAVLTRDRSVTDTVLLSDPAARERAKEFEPPPKDKSRSPSTGEVRLLPSDFACVGLSDEFGVDHWGLKIVKLVAFPDLISSAKIPRRSIPSDPSPPSPIITTPPPEPFEPPFPVAHSHSYSRSSSSSSFNDEEGYFSDSPQSSSYLSLAKPGFRSSSDLGIKSTKSPSYKPPSKHLVSTVLATSPITIPNHSPASSAERNGPFFSYTRTPEGSSLTADVYILATLFPPQERHMVICSGELDAADNRLANGIESEDEDDEQEENTFYLGNALKCLQIDLRRFGLGE